MTVDIGYEPDGSARPQPPSPSSAEPRGMSVITFAGFASLAAGAIHAAAVGIHAEHAQLARIFVAVAVLQLGAGLWAAMRPTRPAALAVIVVNGAAVVGWLTTRLVGISWIDGLEVREAPQFADTACAILGAIAVAAAYTGAILPATMRRRQGLVAPAAVIGLLAVWSMTAAGTHSHADGGHDAAGADHHATDATTADASGVAAGTPAAADDHHATDAATDASHDAVAGAGGVAADDHHATAGAGSTAATDDHHATEAVALAWPRAWDPSQPIDVSGVPGVTAAQELRAIKLIEDTLRELPRFADPADAVAAGYQSIGDGGTGSEHFIKGDLIEDDALLDPTGPESLVYNVVDGKRTLAGAMYIASARPADDPTLTDWAGPLMTWHKHDNLCWTLDESGEAKVVGIIDSEGNCANGVRAGGENPMVHVWITPHECGVFAALEGVGAGTAALTDDQRVDMCQHTHGNGAVIGGPTASAQGIAAPKPYDPMLPIDLSGTPGVTPQQQAAAENLIAVTLSGLPQWSDYRTAEAAGFRSIGDGSVGGHEHFVRWEWINDDIVLDPDFPESLVYEPQADGSKKLVSAMYMLSDDVSLEDVPDIGGPLMQWHIHDNLCFSSDPDQPRVAGITNAAGECPPGLVKFKPAPMIHIWITKHPCGPFAALEGIAAGQIKPGEERLCDTAHGAH